MRKNTEDLGKKRKKDAILGVALFELLQVGVVAVFIAVCLIPGLPRWMVILFAALALICVVPMGLALVVLKQRFQEIQGGEIDAARQY